jgi:thymidylate synthase (FAD)
MVELVKAPYVDLLGSSSFNIDAVNRFIAAHDLKEIAADPNTPIGKLNDSSDSDTDLLAEFAGRFCYRAWKSGRSTDEYIENILSERHGNVIGHPTYHFIVTGVSRALTHELIRHHVGTNPSQESQRYVTAESGEIEVIGYKAMRAVVPPMIMSMMESDRELMDVEKLFTKDFEHSLAVYHHWLASIKETLKSSGLTATLQKKRANEAARCFLPNACETRLVWTMNARSARWVIEQRGDEHADLEIRRLAWYFAKILKQVSPVIFADVEPYTADDGFHAVKVKYSKA